MRAVVSIEDSFEHARGALRDVVAKCETILSGNLTAVVEDVLQHMKVAEVAWRQFGEVLHRKASTAKLGAAWTDVKLSVVEVCRVAKSIKTELGSESAMAPAMKNLRTTCSDLLSEGRRLRDLLGEQVAAQQPKVVVGPDAPPLFTRKTGDGLFQISKPKKPQVAAVAGIATLRTPAQQEQESTVVVSPRKTPTTAADALLSALSVAIQRVLLFVREGGTDKDKFLELSKQVVGLVRALEQERGLSDERHNALALSVKEAIKASMVVIETGSHLEDAIKTCQRVVKLCSQEDSRKAVEIQRVAKWSDVHHEGSNADRIPDTWEGMSSSGILYDNEGHRHVNLANPTQPVAGPVSSKSGKSVQYHYQPPQNTRLDKKKQEARDKELQEIEKMLL